MPRSRPSLVLALIAAAACSSSSGDRNAASQPSGATGVRLVLFVAETALAPGVRLEDAMDQAIRALRRRIEALGLEQPSVFRKDDAIVVEYLTRAPAQIESVVATLTGRHLLRFRLSAHDQPGWRALWDRAREDSEAQGVVAVDEPIRHERGTTDDRYLTAADRATLEAYLARLDVEHAIPSQYELVLEQEPPRPPDQPDARWRTHLVSRSSVLTGEHVTDAKLVQDPQSSTPQVEVEFDAAGARLLELISRENIGTRLVTTLDDRVITAAVIQSAIPGGRAAITMGGSDPQAARDSAQDLVAAIRAGALPTPLELGSTVTFVVP